VPLPELSALAQESEALDSTLAAVPGDAWTRTALGEWSLAELVAHVTRGAQRLEVYLDEPVIGDVVHDRISYWRYDAEVESPAVAQRARDEAAKVDAETLPALFAEAWRASVERAHGLAGDTPMFTPWGTMRLDDYAATRVVEAVVHHMDVRAALDLPPASTPDAARLVMAVLEGLLGTARPRNLGRTRFILAATGRQAVDDSRFPVLR